MIIKSDHQVITMNPTGGGFPRITYCLARGSFGKELRYPVTVLYELGIYAQARS
jgi:hypothetical protein